MNRRATAAIYEGMKAMVRGSTTSLERTFKMSWFGLVIHYYPRTDRYAWYATAPIGRGEDITTALKKEHVLAHLDRILNENRNLLDAGQH